MKDTEIVGLTKQSISKKSSKPKTATPIVLRYPVKAYKKTNFQSSGRAQRSDPEDDELYIPIRVTKVKTTTEKGHNAIQETTPGPQPNENKVGITKNNEVIPNPVANNPTNTTDYYNEMPPSNYDQTLINGTNGHDHLNSIKASENSPKFKKRVSLSFFKIESGGAVTNGENPRDYSKNTELTPKQQRILEQQRVISTVSPDASTENTTPTVVYALPRDLDTRQSPLRDEENDGPSRYPGGRKSSRTKSKQSHKSYHPHQGPKGNRTLRISGRTDGDGLTKATRNRMRLNYMKTIQPATPKDSSVQIESHPVVPTLPVGPGPAPPLAQAQAPVPNVIKSWREQQQQHQDVSGLGSKSARTSPFKLDNTGVHQYLKVKDREREERRVKTEVDSNFKISEQETMWYPTTGKPYILKTSMGTSDSAFSTAAGGYKGLARNSNSSVKKATKEQSVLIRPMSHTSTQVNFAGAISPSRDNMGVGTRRHPMIQRKKEDKDRYTLTFKREKTSASGPSQNLGVIQGQRSRRDLKVKEKAPEVKKSEMIPLANTKSIVAQEISTAIGPGPTVPVASKTRSTHRQVSPTPPALPPTKKVYPPIYSKTKPATVGSKYSTLNSGQGHSQSQSQSQGQGQGQGQNMKQNLAKKQSKVVALSEKATTAAGTANGPVTTTTTGTTPPTTPTTGTTTATTTAIVNVTAAPPAAASPPIAFATTPTNANATTTPAAIIAANTTTTAAGTASSNASKSKKKPLVAANTITNLMRSKENVERRKAREREIEKERAKDKFQEKNSLSSKSPSPTPHPPSTKKIQKQDQGGSGSGADSKAVSKTKSTVSTKVKAKVEVKAGEKKSSKSCVSVGIKRATTLKASSESKTTTIIGELAKLQKLKLPILWLFGYTQLSIIGNVNKVLNGISKNLDFYLIDMDEEIQTWTSSKIFQQQQRLQFDGTETEKLSASSDNKEKVVESRTTSQSKAKNKTSFNDDIIIQATKILTKVIGMVNKILGTDDILELITLAMIRAQVEEDPKPKGYIIKNFPLYAEEGEAFENYLYEVTTGLYILPENEIDRSILTTGTASTIAVNFTEFFTREHEYSEIAVREAVDHFGGKYPIQIFVSNDETATIREGKIQEVIYLVQSRMQMLQQLRDMHKSDATLGAGSHVYVDSKESNRSQLLKVVEDEGHGYASDSVGGEKSHRVSKGSRGRRKKTAKVEDKDKENEKEAENESDNQNIPKVVNPTKKNRSRSESVKKTKSKKTLDNNKE